MKASYKLSDKLQFEVEGEGQKEIFKEIASIQEIFGETACGMCGSENIKFVVRVVEDNEYYELRCMDCGATLAFGQHKQGGTLFPKRKDEKGEYMPNRGWYKWQGK